MFGIKKYRLIAGLATCVTLLAVVSSVFAETVTWNGAGTDNGYCNNFVPDGNVTPGKQVWFFALNTPDIGPWTLTANFDDGTQMADGTDPGSISVSFYLTTNLNARLLSASATGAKSNSLLSVVSCAYNPPTFTPTYTATATQTPITFTPTYTATATRTPVTFTPTYTATATRTPVTFTPTYTATATRTPVTFTPTYTMTATNTPIVPTNTPTNTATNTPVVPTNTPTNTATNTPIVPTNTPTNTATNTPIVPTNTPTNTATNTPIVPTNTPTNTATNTPIVPTNTPTNTATNTPVFHTNTPTFTPTRTPTPRPLWCSPGFWKNHLNLWPGGTATQSLRYNALFDPDLSGNPTLLQVVQKPQQYGGAAANVVANYLAGLEGWTGTQATGDNCPL